MTRPRYRQDAPPPDLQPVVAAVWSLRGPGKTPIWPDGCVDLIALLRPDGVAVVVTPPTLRADQALSGPDDLYVGVRLRPGAAAGLLGDAAAETSARLAGKVGEDEASVRSVLLESARKVEGPPPLVRLGLRRIAQTGGALRVEELARELGVSPRTLGRLFAEHVGASPKALARVARSRRAMRALSDPAVELGRLAAELGFADQAHLTRELVEMLGATPGELRGVAPPSRICSRPRAT